MNRPKSWCNNRKPITFKYTRNEKMHKINDIKIFGFVLLIIIVVIVIIVIVAIVIVYGNYPTQL